MKLKKDFIVMAVGHFIEALILFGTTRVMTWMLSPQEVGYYALIYAFVTMFFSLFVVPPSLYTQRRFHEWNAGLVLSDYTKKFVIYLVLAGILSGVIAVLLRGAFHMTFPFSDLVVFGLVAGVIMFMNLNTFFYSSLNMFQMRLHYVACSIATGLLVLVSATLFSLWLGKRAEIWILGQIIGNFSITVIGAMVFFGVLKSHGHGKGVWSWKKIRIDVIDLFQFCWPIFVGAFVLWVQNESYRFLLSFVAGVKIIGLFSVGFNLGNKLIQKVLLLIQNFYNPIFFQSIADAQKKDIENACTKYVSVFLPVIILLGFFICSGSHFMAVIFVAPAFQKAAGIALFWSGLVCIFWGILAAYRLFAVAVMNLRVVIIPYLMGAVVVVILIPLLCRSTPFMGAGIALTLGAVVSSFSLIISMRRLLDIVFPWRRIGESLLWALPFVAVGFGLSRMMPNPGIAQSLVVICVLGVLEVAAQLKLARPWLVVRKLAE